MKRTFLLAIGLSSVLLANLSKTGNIVTDSATGLQWQDDESVSTINRTWTGAIDYCETLSLDGYDDWRLPNINELTSLVNDSKDDPSISDVFEHVTYHDCWSSTTYDDGHGHRDDARVVFFNHGSQGTHDKSDSRSVRCVRSGQ